MAFPRTTQTWLKPLYDALDGRGVRQPVMGSSTGTIGMYGTTGIAGRLATGTAGITAWTGAGASAGLLWFNGGSGAFYTIGDVVVALKNMGVLKA